LQRVQSSYQRLTAVASQLNGVSDQLGRAINALDESLKQLNLGIVHWHQFDGGENESGAYWCRYIGYAKVGTRWGIALRTTTGHHEAPPDFGSDDWWLFNDAPRQLRMEAVDHIPAMIDSLITAAEEAVAKITEKTAEAKNLAELLAPAKPKSVPRR
jgi:hypothetical protein